MSSNRTRKASGKKAARRKTKSAKKAAKKSAKKKVVRKRGAVARAPRRAAAREVVRPASFAPPSPDAKVTREAASALADVELEKLVGSPAEVRVKLDGQSGFIMAAGETRGVIKSVVVGSFVRIWVDVSGNPGASATLKVAKASPSSVKVTIPPDKGQWSESQSLQVTG